MFKKGYNKKVFFFNIKISYRKQYVFFDIFKLVINKITLHYFKTLNYIISQLITFQKSVSKLFN